VSYTTADARQQLLDVIATAVEQLGGALAALSEAYEQLDESTGDRLERELFRPVQVAYGRAQRTHAEFADRHDLTERAFAPAIQAAPSLGAKALVERAVVAAQSADSTLGTLQDSMLPVEVGDAELRAGIEDVRVQLDHIRARARELLRTFGR
jgi:phage shock protein A